MVVQYARILFTGVCLLSNLANAKLQDSNLETLADAEIDDYVLLCEYEKEETPVEKDPKPNLQERRSDHNFIYGQETASYSHDKTHYRLKQKPDLNYGLNIVSPSGVIQLEQGEFEFDSRTNQIILRKKQEWMHGTVIWFYYRPESEVLALKKSYGDLSLNALDSLDSLEKGLKNENPSQYQYRAYTENGRQRLELNKKNSTSYFYDDDVKKIVKHLERLGISGENNLEVAEHSQGQEIEVNPTDKTKKDQVLPDKCYISQKKDKGLIKQAFTDSPSILPSGTGTAIQ